MKRAALLILSVGLDVNFPSIRIERRVPDFHIVGAWLDDSVDNLSIPAQDHYDVIATILVRLPAPIQDPFKGCPSWAYVGTVRAAASKTRAVRLRLLNIRSSSSLQI